MIKKRISLFFILALSYGLVSCKEQQPQQSIYNAEIINNSRICEALTYDCLPESQSPKRQQEISRNITIIQQLATLLSPEEAKAIWQRQERRNNLDIIKKMEWYYPDFWQGVPKKMRLQWLMEVDKLVKRYDLYGDKDELQLMALIVAILGFDFDKNPDYELITKHLQRSDVCKNCRLTNVVNYLFYYYLKKDKDKNFYDYKPFDLEWLTRLYFPNTSRENFNRQAIDSTRLCTAMKYECQPKFKDPKTQQRINANEVTPMKDVYQLSEKEEQAIELRRQQREYKEITQMMELYYPGFWQDKSQEERVQWVMEAEKLVHKYDLAGSRGRIELMAMICGIIGLDFDQNPDYDFIIRHFKRTELCKPCRLVDTFDYLYFNYLEKDFDDGGYQYNTWRLRDVMTYFPESQRHIPSFTHEFVEYNREADIDRIYWETIRNGGEQR